MFKLACIVEGETEEIVLPMLLKRWLERQKRAGEVTVLDPTRAQGKGHLVAVPKSSRRPDRGIELYVDLVLQAGPDGILILLDGDDDCASGRRWGELQEALGPYLKRRAENRVKTSSRRHVPVAVVVADRTLETWLVAGWYGLCRAFDKDPSTSHSENVEGRSCQGRLEELLGEKYKKVRHASKMGAHLPVEGAILDISRSYRKLWKEVTRLLEETRSL